MSIRYAVVISLLAPVWGVSRVEHVETRIVLPKVLEVEHQGHIDVGHPTVRCVDLIPEHEEPSQRNHRGCHAHCKTLPGYGKGECVKGICHCSGGRITERGHPTVKCIHITYNGGVRRRDNHEACQAHCRTLGGFHEGKCLDDICHCQKKVEPRVHCEHNNHEVCHTHCRKMNHDVARCKNGVCQCGETEETARAQCEHVKDRKQYCSAHCRDLGEAEGDCIGGVCQCRQVELTHPTIRCEVGQHADQHCKTHCLTIHDGYTGGHCLSGICHCRAAASFPVGYLIDKVSSHPTIKCGEIPGHHEENSACRTHCRTIHWRYREGQCVKGVCHCYSEHITRLVVQEEKEKPEIRSYARTEFVAESVECGGERKYACERHCEQLHASGKCLDGVCHCLTEQQEVRCSSNGVCEAHCSSLHYRKGECVRGYCLCEDHRHH